MGGSFSGQLDDVLSQVGFVDINPILLEDLIEVQLLGDHRLALGGYPYPPAGGQLRHDCVGLRRVLSEVDVSAGPFDIFRQQFEIVIQVLQGMDFDLAGLFTPFLPAILSNLIYRFQARAVETGSGPPQGLLQLGILHRDYRGGKEVLSVNPGHYLVSPSST